MRVLVVTLGPSLALGLSLALVLRPESVLSPRPGWMCKSQMSSLPTLILAAKGGAKDAMAPGGGARAIAASRYEVCREDRYPIGLDSPGYEDSRSQPRPLPLPLLLLRCPYQCHALSLLLPLRCPYLP